MFELRSNEEYEIIVPHAYDVQSDNSIQYINEMGMACELLITTSKFLV